MAKILHPKSEAEWLHWRTADVTSTESAALLGLHPRLTLFELHHRKRGAYDVPFEATERTIWGTRLQDVIAAGVAEDYAVKVRRANYYARHDECRMGASFDFEIVGTVDDFPPFATEIKFSDSNIRSLHDAHGPGILEIKNVDSLVFANDWLVEKTDDGKKSIEAPIYIELQLQHQLECIGREWGVIAALVGGNRPVVIARQRDREIGQRLRNHVDIFWKRIEQDLDPAPDFKRDGDVIAKLYGFAEPNKILDARGDEKFTSLCAEYKEWADVEKNAKEEKQARKAQLLTMIGNAEKVLVDHFTISAGVVGPSTYTVERGAYRNWKVTPKKAKAVA